jgi:hypothetical protein
MGSIQPHRVKNPKYSSRVPSLEKKLIKFSSPRPGEPPDDMRPHLDQLSKSSWVRDSYGNRSIRAAVAERSADRRSIPGSEGESPTWPGAHPAHETDPTRCLARGSKQGAHGPATWTKSTQPEAFISSSYLELPRPDSLPAPSSAIPPDTEHRHPTLSGLPKLPANAPDTIRGELRREQPPGPEISSEHSQSAEPARFLTSAKLTIRTAANPPMGFAALHFARARISIPVEAMPEGFRPKTPERAIQAPR